MAKVRCFSPDGEEVVLSLLGPGDLFGDMTLLDEEPRSADVIALIRFAWRKFPGAVVRRLMLGRAVSGDWHCPFAVQAIAHLEPAFCCACC